MRTRLLLLSIVVISCLNLGCTTGHENKPNAMRLRVMTYNIHHAAGLDTKLDAKRIAEVIKDAKPDLVALQEVDKGVSRSGNKDQAAQLGKLTGMHGIFGKATDWDGGDYGCAILSRLPYNKSTTQPLPVTGKREPRVAVAIYTSAPKQTPLIFVATHLEHQNQGDRMAQAKALKDWINTFDYKNVILAGDFNAQKDNEALGLFFKDGWTNASGNDDTFPSPLPMRKIDWILLPPGSGWRVKDVDVPAERVASDHRPVVVELEWAAKRPKSVSK
ncbi:MAG TPA: endonuclease/exonuclease/phosphatase family protein [Tepidisphaeraceae bacterium]|jgi:endonuclease/exonuclease/phosphatase family metal-dependent hydrolase